MTPRCSTPSTAAYGAPAGKRAPGSPGGSPLRPPSGNRLRVRHPRQPCSISQNSSARDAMGSLAAKAARSAGGASPKATATCGTTESNFPWYGTHEGQRCRIRSVISTNRGAGTGAR